MAHYDLLVLGSGPAGQKAAIQAAKLRKKVAIVEKEQVGGASVNTGTLPSKTLKDAIYYLHGAKLRSFTNMSVSLKKSFTMSDLMARKDHVIKNELAIITNQLERNDVEIVHGTASFHDAHTIRVATQHGHEELLSADFIVIATGSRPRHEPAIPFNSANICDSDSILAADTMPKTMAVLGGGVIGCEYACIFRAIGFEVTVVDGRSTIMQFVDGEAAQALAKSMEESGIKFVLGSRLKDAKVRGPIVHCALEDGKVLETEVLFFAAGRTPNTDKIGLERLGIKIG